MVESGAGDPASGRIDGEPGIVERYGSVRARKQRNCPMSSPSADPRSPRACSARGPNRDPDVLIRLLYGAAMQPERWPETLDAAERARWDDYRCERLADGSGLSELGFTGYFDRIAILRDERAEDPGKLALLDALEDWGRTLQSSLTMPASPQFEI